MKDKVARAVTYIQFVQQLIESMTPEEMNVLLAKLELKPDFIQRVLQEAGC